MDRVAISYYRAPHSLTMRVRGTQRDAILMDAEQRDERQRRRVPRPDCLR